MKKILIILLITCSYVSTVFSETSKTKIDYDRIIEDYIMNNPEIIIKSLEKYSKEREQVDKELSLRIMESYYKDQIYNKFPSIGKEKTNLILSEFIDYNCGYCKKTLKTIIRLTEEIKNLKIVFIDYPILSESSELAARAALAAGNQEAYFKYHSLLLEQNQPLTEGFLLNLAKNLNLNLEKFKKDLYSESIKNKINANIQIAQSLKIRGTPTFLLDTQILPGAYDYKKLKKMILDKN